MTWTRPADLRDQVERLWERGVLLAELVGEDPPTEGMEGRMAGELPVTETAPGSEANLPVIGTSSAIKVEATPEPAGLFPLRLKLRRPTSAEILDRFGEVQDWITELLRGRHYRVELREVRHRVVGTNTIPYRIWVDTVEDALALVGRVREANKFRALVAFTRNRHPELIPWLSRNSLQALGLAEEWPLLLDVVAWIRAQPRPGVYLRQVDLPGVHSKFIEAHRSVLAELLDLTLPPNMIDTTATGVGGFARRYGFRERPLRVRFRILDPRHALLPGGTDREGGAGQEVYADQDIELTAAAFARLEVGVTRVFITENEVNLLAFPPLPDTMIIFGSGYGFDMLAEAEWLELCTVYYWGDIDTHGFAILDQLRAHLPHTKSFLMDRATLMAHEPLWGDETRPTRRDLTRLEPQEHMLYEELRNGKPRAGVRLEQERVSFSWLWNYLERLPGRA